MSETITAIGKRRTSPFRAPRAQLLINGAIRAETPIQGFSLNRTRYSRADTATLTLAVDRTALAKLTAPYWFDPTASADVVPPDIDVVIQMRDAMIDGSPWTNMFQGIVDQVSWSPTGTAMMVECRDYLAKLLDMRVQQAWLNLTGAELITDVIKAAGLTPNVAFPANLTGQFWQIEHKRTSSAGQHRFQTAYDLCRYIANVAQCDLYASGKTINCVPFPTPGDGTATHTIAYTDTGSGPIVSDVMGLSLQRDFLIAKGVTVHAMAWDSRQRTKNEIYWSALGKGRAASENAGTLYTFRAPPGSKQQAVEAFAKQKYDEIISHAREASFSIPGKLNLEPRQFYKLSGTNTSWDMSGKGDDIYSVDSVETNYDFEKGFGQHVMLRNRATSDGAGTSDDA